MLETFSTVLLVSSVESPTIRMRLAPVPTVCDHVTVAAFTADFETALSKAIAATADSLRNNIAMARTAIARYKRRKDARVVFMRLDKEEGWVERSRHRLELGVTRLAFYFLRKRK